MKVSIIGSGSWGTALAQVLADNKVDVCIWGRNVDELVDISKYHQNEKYFPGIKLNKAIKVSTSVKKALEADVIILSVPSGAIDEISQLINKTVKKPVIIVNTAKGYHPISHKRLSVVIEENIDASKRLGVVSLIGPSHAEEVVLRQLTVLNAVSESEECAKTIQHLFANHYFRVYRSQDVIGSEIGVANKNIIAIASGILSGLGFGDNARAALITRGIAEMTRYGLFFGAKAETFLGLTGIGDLVVTSTSVHSRNFQAGLVIGQQDGVYNFLESTQKTIEGVKACKIVHEEATKQNISMPITEAVYKVLYEGAKPSEISQDLMVRELKSEDI